MAIATESIRVRVGARRGVLRAQHRKEGLVRSLCFLAAAMSVLTTFGIVYILFSQTFGFFAEVSPKEFFFGKQWTPLFDPQHFGAAPLVCGTLLITVGAGIVAIPMGLLIGVFLSEYASAKVRAFFKPAIELLAGVPSVVYGYLALFTVTPILRSILPSTEVYNAASGAIVVGIMVLPLVASLCEDTLSAVPKALREAAYGLGSTRMEVTVKIVIPSALSGIMASFILALSRAIGETMAVTLASGASPKLTLNPLVSIQTMTSYIVTATSGDVRAGSVGYNSVFAVGALLFTMTMLMNIFALRLVRRYRKVYA